jgi:N-acetylmuramoyl-L-alanine amidase
MAAQSPAIEGVSNHSTAAMTTITVELNGPVHPHKDVLENPPRAWIDLPQTKLHLPGRGTRTYTVDDGIVRQIRVAPYTPTTARIVIDLEHEASVRVSTTRRRPYRLNIDVLLKGGRKQAAAETAIRSGTKPAPMPPAERGAPVVAEPRSGAAAVENVPQAQAAEPPAGKDAERSTERAGTVKPETKPEARTEAGRPDGPATAPAKLGGTTLTRALGLKVGRVVIDAGHGGHDEGTRGPSGLLEKELTLDVAHRLGALIEQRLGSEVIYTRSSDVYVGLEERTAIANREGADLFLSIHANSSPIKNISGSDVYYLSFTTSKAALDVASRENAATNQPIHELQDLLKKIALNDKVAESQMFAARVQRELASTWSKTSGGTRNRPVKKAPFVVLIGARMPSVLAEIGFISNPRDEALLKRGEQRQRIAEALFRGVNAYANTLSRVERPRASR